MEPFEDLKQSIEAAGHWRIEIMPLDFSEQRIPRKDLEAVIAKAVVRFRGWDYPYLAREDNQMKMGSFLSGKVDWERHREVWRFYRSGQFLHVVEFSENFPQYRKALEEYARHFLDEAG